MHVVDTPDVFALVNAHSHLEGTGKYVTYGVQIIPSRTEVQRLVGVGNRYIQNLTQLTFTPNRPGVRHNVRQPLLRVVDNYISNHCIGLE